MTPHINSLQDNKRDFRIIPFGCVLIYILTLLYSEFYLGSYSVVAVYFGIEPIPYFVDLKILLCGIDAIREHLDPYMVNCVNNLPYFNYPLIWGIFSFLPFITVPNLFYIGFTLVVTLFTALYFYIGRINFFAAVVYTLLLVSPAIMLGVERGNCDLIVFLVLLIPLFYKKSQRLFAFTILFAAMLKLFPIGTIACLLNNGMHKLKKTLVLIVSIGVIFLIYLFIMKDNILMVSEKTPRPFGGVSYGLGTLPAMLSDYFKSNSSFMIFTVFSILFFLGFILFYRYANKMFERLIIDSGKIGMSYLMGAGIFITTCIIGYNWEYRLIFLLLTIPQILSWHQEKKLITAGLLALTIVVVWQSFIRFILGSLDEHLANYYNVISALLAILLFYYHTLLLIKFLIGCYKQVVPIKFTLKKS